MMFWNGMGGWGYLFMGLSTIVFWGLLIACAVLVVRALRPNPSDPNPPGPNQHGPSETPERLLAGRYARGEITDDEYHHRLETLRRS